MGLFDIFKRPMKKENTEIENNNDDLDIVTYKGNGNPEENFIYNLYLKYEDNLDYDIIIEPASIEQLTAFENNCNKYNISKEIKDKMIEYYKLNNNLFNYFKCDDISIFEWYTNKKELWLGQRDLYTFRYIESINKFAIGDATTSSFGEEYEFNSIIEMIESFISGKTI